MKNIISNASSSRLKQKQYSLGRNLLFWFLVLALLPLLFSAWYGYKNASSGLKNIAIQEIEQGSDLNRRFIHNWFEYRFMDVNNLADNLRNIQFLELLVRQFSKSNLSLSDYVKSNDWSLLVDKYKIDLNNLQNNYDYIHDIFLVDNLGNLLFSVAGKNDLGTNLFTGRLANTRFSKSVLATLKTGKTLFSDIERYAPSNNQLAGFLTAPVTTENGDIIGVVSIQLHLESILNLLTNTTHRSLRHYIVGEDKFLRTPTSNTGFGEVLHKQIDTEQFKLWYSEHGKYGALSPGMDETAFTYVGPYQKTVFGLHRTIRVPGVNWVLISEIDEDEALIAASQLGNITIVFF